MKIVYIHQLFKTPDEGGGTRSWYLAKALVDAGHEVHLISSHNRKAGVDRVNGIHVHYVRVSYDNAFGFFRRLWAYGLFVIKARKEARKIGKADLAYVMTTPLTTGFIATWIKKRMGLPYFFEVGDLWPDVPIEMGVIQNAWLKKWLYKLEKNFYDQAETVIALSPDIEENIKNKTDTPIAMIPNMADVAFYQPTYREEEISHQKPLRILYCGAHGRANHLEFLLEAARASQDLPVAFTLMGAGSEKTRLMDWAKGLDNVTFRAHGNKEEVREALRNHDAIYVSFQKLKTLHTGSPNKFFDGMAAGKMIISNLAGWTAEVIQRQGLGFAYAGDQPEQFAERIQSYLKKEAVKKAQENARKTADKYAKERLEGEFLKLLEN